jgi:hypothetical protein
MGTGSRQCSSVFYLLGLDSNPNCIINIPSNKYSYNTFNGSANILFNGSANMINA